MQSDRRFPVGRGLSLCLLAVALMLVGCESNPRLRQQGINALSMGQVERADMIFAKALRNDPADWKAMYYMGLVRLKQGRALDAQVYLERALTLRPTHEETEDIYDALAESLYQQKEIPALHALLRRSASETGSVRGFLRQAKYFGKLGDVDGTKTAFRKAIRFSQPGDARPYVAMADYFESVGDRTNTVTALRQAYYIAPNYVGLHGRLIKYGVQPGPGAGLPPETLPPE